MEGSMSTEQQAKEQEKDAAQQPGAEAQHPDTDGLKDKKPEELTPDELRLMADTMPGEGPGD
jgi:hypothetical protein